MLTVDPPALAAELAAAMPTLDEADQRLALSLYRLLARGVAVTADELARDADRPVAEVSSVIANWPGVFRDDQARVVGFWGLALSEMGHRLEIDGSRLYAWCAYDTLFLPELIGKPASVESTCPTTGETIRLRVDANGIEDLAPETTVVSFLRPEGKFDAQVIQSFCHYVHFFSSPEAAQEWTAQHPGTFTLSPSEAYDIARRTNHMKFAAALSR